MNKADQEFEIFGRIIPEFSGGMWTYTEEIYEDPYVKRYPDDAPDYTEYIDDPEKAVFLAYDEKECVGQIVLLKNWNGYAFIEDICVAAASRKNGIGTALMRKAEEWAKDTRLKGLALETQDNNLAACRFYAKYGFVIGAVDTMLYRNSGDREYAVFWYLIF